MVLLAALSHNKHYGDLRWVSMKWMPHQKLPVRHSHYRSLVSCVLHEVLWYILSLIFHPSLSVCISCCMPRLLASSSRLYQGLILSQDPQSEWPHHDSGSPLCNRLIIIQLFDVSSVWIQARKTESSMRRLKPRGNVLRETSLHSFLWPLPPTRSIDASGRLPAMFPVQPVGIFLLFSAPQSPCLPIKTLPHFTRCNTDLPLPSYARWEWNASFSVFL